MVKKTMFQTSISRISPFYLFNHIDSALLCAFTRQCRRLKAWHDANLNLQHCEWLWRWRGAVIVIILLYKALIKLPHVLSPVARQRIPLATSGISFTKKFSGLNWIWPSFSCQKFMGGLITLKVRMKVDVIDFDMNIFKKNEMALSATFIWLHLSLSHQQSSQSFKLEEKYTWTEIIYIFCLKKPNHI